jgi:hypothetical protein
MELPRTIKLGKYRYYVAQPQQMGMVATRGRIDYSSHQLLVARQCNVTMRTYPKKERAEIFWHEAVHGILFDMGHHLAHDERFVNAFSKRLNDAIHSATF